MRLLLATTVVFALTLLSAAQQPRPPAGPANPTKGGTPAGASSAPKDAAVPFQVGETLTYDVSWSQFLTAGTAVVKVAEKKPSAGSTAYSIVADGRPLPLVARFYPVYYRMDSLVDSITMLTQSTSLYSEENGRKRQTSTRFDRRAGRAFYEVPADGVKDDFEVPANVQDGLAALYAVRGRAFKVGERFTIPIADDGSMYGVEFETTGQERVRVPLGDLSAWNLKITILDHLRQPAASNTGAWISTDARRLPIKLQTDLPIGSFVLALREARP